MRRAEQQALTAYVLLARDPMEFLDYYYFA